MGGANETRAARLTLGAVSRGAAGVTTARDLLAPVVGMAGAATAPTLARGREVGGASDTRVARLTLVLGGASATIWAGVIFGTTGRVAKAPADTLARGRVIGANDTRVARLTLALVGATSAREGGVVKVVAATTGAATSFLITSGNLR